MRPAPLSESAQTVQALRRTLLILLVVLGGALEILQGRTAPVATTALATVLLLLVFAVVPLLLGHVADRSFGHGGAGRPSALVEAWVILAYLMLVLSAARFEAVGLGSLNVWRRPVFLLLAALLGGPFLVPPALPRLRVAGDLLLGVLLVAGVLWLQTLHGGSFRALTAGWPERLRLAVLAAAVGLFFVRLHLGVLADAWSVYTALPATGLLFGLAAVEPAKLRDALEAAKAAGLFVAVVGLVLLTARLLALLVAWAAARVAAWRQARKPNAPST